MGDVSELEYELDQLYIRLEELSNATSAKALREAADIRTEIASIIDKIAMAQDE